MLKNSLVSKVLTVLTLIVILSINSLILVSAKSIDLEPRINVSKWKNWTIKLGQEVSLDGLADKIKVTDSRGQGVPVRITLGADNRIINVLQLYTYSTGETYKLSILEGIVSKDKKSTLKDTTSMKFTINNDTAQIYFNKTKVEFPDNMPLRVIDGRVYIPLEIMTNIMGLDTTISVANKPNIQVTTAEGLVTEDFRSATVTTPKGEIIVPGTTIEKIDSNGKHVGTYVPARFFADALGFKFYDLATLVNDITNHKINIDGVIGTGGTLTIKEAPVVVPPVYIDPLDYIIVPTKPSVNSDIPNMVNLQALAKLIQKDDIMNNDYNGFRYDIASFATTYQNCITYGEIMVQGDLPTNPIGVKLVKCMLADIVGDSDSAELYAALLEYSKTFLTEGNTDSITNKYHGYRLTKSKLYQYEISNIGDQSFLDIKLPSK